MQTSTNNHPPQRDAEPPSDESIVVHIPMMPEQVVKFQAWADHIGIPLSRFVREAAEITCLSLTGDYGSESHPESQDGIVLDEDYKLLLN